MSTSIQNLLSDTSQFVLTKSIENFHKGKTVLITGAGGSVGSELAFNLATVPNIKLVLLDISELGLFNLENRFANLQDQISCCYELGDICDKVRMKRLFQKCLPDIVYHAAAYKHVSMLEMQPYEAIKVNIAGTIVLSELARKFNVQKFVFISSDKAVNPIGILGYSKRLAELYIRGIQISLTKFVITRFGNVLGSSGSLIPKIQRQIELGGPVTLTDREAERYFMTKSSACQLVLESGVIGKNRDFFLFDMGKPHNVLEVIEVLISIHKKKASKRVEIVVKGLSQGEKLKEELVGENEILQKTDHPKILKLHNPLRYTEGYEALIKSLCLRNSKGEIADYKLEFENILNSKNMS